MSPGAFTLLLSALVGLPAETLAVIDRYLRTAGLRAKSGRGSGAAKITPRDAAHLLVALLGGGEPKNAVQAVRRYAATRQLGGGKSAYRKTGIAELAALSKDHSFIDALEALIGSAMSGSLSELMTSEAKKVRGRKADGAPIIDVAALTPGTVGDIRLAGLPSGETASVRYALPSPWDGKPRGYAPPEADVEAWEASVKKHRGGDDVDMETYRRISARTIVRIAEALAPDKEKQ